MENSMVNPIIKNYLLIEKLGEGYSSRVFLATDKDTSKNIAIKIFKKSINQVEIENEIKLFESINHYQLIKLLDYGKEFLHINKKKKMVNFMVFELLESGEIFEYLMIKRFPPKIAIHYFKELLHLLQFFKNKSFCHRDLKPENLLFDNDFNLKIIDLGFSKISENNTKLNTCLGTDNYSAPEILMRKSYDGYKSDLFSIGIIFFIMLTGKPPFVKASKNCKYYNLIYNKEYEKFWKIHEKFNPNINFIPQIKNLFENMFNFNSDNRLKIEEILQYNFIKENKINKGYLINYLTNIRNILSLKNENFIYNKIKTNKNKTKRKKTL